jgi:hypothetical protein
MPEPDPRLRHPAEASSRQDFVTDIMEPDDAWGFHLLVIIAVHRFPDPRPQFLKRLALSVDPDSERRGRKTAFHFIFADFKNDLTHFNLDYKTRPLILQARDGVARPLNGAGALDWD